MNKPNMIGIGATALVGKDTLFKILDKLYPNTFERVALADLLKAELDEFCKKHYGISAFTKDPKEKEIIRSLFVVHGKIKRWQFQGTYWTGLVQERIDDIISDGLIPVCTDIRYSTFPKDEIFWLKEKNKGVYIHLSRFNKDGSKVEPANDDEREQEKILRNYADYLVSWNTSDNEDYLVDTIKIQLKDLLEKIK